MFDNVINYEARDRALACGDIDAALDIELGLNSTYQDFDEEENAVNEPWTAEDEADYLYDQSRNDD